MGCGCNQYRLYGYCNCNQSSCCAPSNTPQVASNVIATNSWNVPALNDTAELDVAVVKTLTPGNYLQHLTYGKFLITSFNASTAKVVIKNTGFVFNAVSGTIVPAYTVFDIRSGTFSKEGNYTPVLPTVSSMLITLDDIRNASYQISDSRAWLDLSLEFTIGGTPTDHMLISLPFTAVDIDSVLTATMDNQDPHELMAYARISNGTDIVIRRLDDATFNAGASSLNLSGSYKLQPL